MNESSVVDQRSLIIGDGWLGRALAAVRPDYHHVPQRHCASALTSRWDTLIVTSGWSRLPDGSPDAADSELADVSNLLDAARRFDARVVVVGSSDVCGLAREVQGTTPVAPVTAYGELKARREGLVVEAHDDGVDAVAVRLAPTHGPGKAQSHRMVSLAGRRRLVLPHGGRYSVGFITLADAVAGLDHLAAHSSAPVVSLGAGETELRILMSSMAEAHGMRAVVVPVPVPARLAQRLARSGSSSLAWIGRFSLPRTVAMEAGIEPMSTRSAARYLVDAMAPAAS